MRCDNLNPDGQPTTKSDRNLADWMFSDVEDRGEPKVKRGKPGGVTNGSWARVGRMKQHGVVSEKFIQSSLELFSFALKVFQSGACETTQPFSECDKKRGQRMRGTSEWELQEFS